MSGRIILENVSENKQLVKIGHLHILMAQTDKKDGNMGRNKKITLQQIFNNGQKFSERD